MVGKVFGKLTVIERTNERVNNSVVWKCKCECGNIVVKKANWLKTGSVQSCGCLHSETSAINGHNSMIDLSNQRFGKLVALYPTEKRARSGSIVWHCVCDCGEEKDIASTDLVQNKTHSCGKCGYQAEMSSKNLLGQIFGRLTVIEKTDKRASSGSIIWKCQCECGNIIEVPTNALTSAHTMSCGCLQSKGEYNIAQLLNVSLRTYFRKKAYENYAEYKKIEFRY